jgi:hypothetical protein
MKPIGEVTFGEKPTLLHPYSLQFSFKAKIIPPHQYTNPQ